MGSVYRHFKNHANGVFDRTGCRLAVMCANVFIGLALNRTSGNYTRDGYGQVHLGQMFDMTQKQHFIFHGKPELKTTLYYT